MPGAKKICIVGSGNWGSAIAKIVGENVSGYPDKVSIKWNIKNMISVKYLFCAIFLIIKS